MKEKKEVKIKRNKVKLYQKYLCFPHLYQTWVLHSNELCDLELNITNDVSHCLQIKSLVYIDILLVFSPIYCSLY